MSAFDYAYMRAVSLRLITKFGSTQTLYSLTGTPSYSIKAVFLPLETSNVKEDTKIERNVENTLSKRVVFYSATSISPIPGWYLSQGTEYYTIKEITEIKPTDTVLYYDCVVER